MVGKIFFKPYLISKFCGLQKRECSVEFKNNTIVLGYTLIGILTDVVFEAYYQIFLENGLNMENNGAIMKNKIFQDLMPIRDNFVRYSDLKPVYLHEKDWKHYV